MDESRWADVSVRDYEKALALGATCGATVGEGYWRAVCNLLPGHDLPHEDWRGCGTVTFRTWPFTPAATPPVDPAPAARPVRARASATSGSRYRAARSAKDGQR